MANEKFERNNWESSFYLAPCGGLELGGYDLHHWEPTHCEFTLSGVELALNSSIPVFREVRIVGKSVPNFSFGVFVA
ncbi:MAG: hypothetical protein WCV67_03635 [Victivallaceae bacterium]